MRTKILLLLMIIIWNIGFADAVSGIHEDTLRLKTMPADTAKCNLLNRVAEELRDHNTHLGLKYAKESMNLSINLKYSQGIAGGNKAMGLNYWRMGVYDAALEHFLIAIKLYDEQSDEYNIAKCNNNIGLIFFARDQYDKALIYLNRSLKTHRANNNPKEIARVLHNMGLITFQLNNIQKSLDHHFQSLHYAQLANDTLLQAYNYCFIGRDYTHISQFEKAKTNLQKSMDLFVKINNLNNIAMVNNYFADYYNTLQQYRLAIEYAQNGYNLGEKVGNKYMMMESAELIYKAYQGLKDYPNALEFALRHYKLKDTMINESNIEAIAHKEAHYEYEKKFKELEIDKENEIYKSRLITNVAIAASVLLLFVAIIIFAFYRLKSKTNNLLILKNSQISQLNSDLEKANAEKDKFLSIIAHDLKNPIGNLMMTTNMLSDYYETMTKAEHKELIQLLKDSSTNTNELLENLLDWSRSRRGKFEFVPESVNLGDLSRLTIDILNHAATNKSIKIVNNIDNHLNCYADANMITAVIRNLLSNAIKFTPYGGSVEIGAVMQATDKTLTVFIKDSGIGMNEKTIEKLFKIDETVSTTGTAGEKGTGLGLILCKEFIDKHNGKIWVESKENNGSTFYFTLPGYI